MAGGVPTTGYSIEKRFRMLLTSSPISPISWTERTIVSSPISFCPRRWSAVQKIDQILNSCFAKIISGTLHNIGQKSWDSCPRQCSCFSFPEGRSQLHQNFLFNPLFPPYSHIPLLPNLASPVLRRCFKFLGHQSYGMSKGVNKNKKNSDDGTWKKRSFLWLFCCLPQNLAITRIASTLRLQSPWKIESLIKRVPQTRQKLIDIASLVDALLVSTDWYQRHYYSRE